MSVDQHPNASGADQIAHDVNNLLSAITAAATPPCHEHLSMPQRGPTCC